MRKYGLLIAGTIVLALALVMAALTAPARADDANGRPTDPPLVCATVDQAQCRAVLTNTWDGRQVVHQLDPVPSCDTTVLRERLDRKNAKLRQLRERIARLRGR